STVYAGGGFTQAGGVAHTGLVAADPLTGAPDPAFPSAAEVTALFQTRDHLYAGGRLIRSGAVGYGAAGFAGAPGPRAGSGGAVAGRVMPNGDPTTYAFEYGPTEALGTSTPAAAAGTGDDTIAVSTTLTGLMPGTTYRYRLAVTNAGGTARGEVLTFTTLPRS